MYHTTFDNKKVPLSEITHQHLSNIYWFTKIINGYNYSATLITIDEKYDGVILPYKPEPRFRLEIEELDKRGFLRWRDNESKADIIYNGDVVGEAFYLEDKRDSIIDEIISDEEIN